MLYEVKVRIHKRNIAGDMKESWLVNAISKDEALEKFRHERVKRVMNVFFEDREYMFVSDVRSLDENAVLSVEPIQMDMGE